MPQQDGLRRAVRADLSGSAVEVAPLLLGAELRTFAPATDERGPVEVRLRITEVEAYHGQGTGEIADPGSHARMGRTPRNATMWGEPGHLYVYLSHGIHSCVNVVCGPIGQGDGVLLRAGEIVIGADAAARRRGATLPLSRIARRDLARGPGRLGQAVGLRHPLHDGIDAITGEERHGARAELWLGEPRDDVVRGPRVGVAGVAGTAAFPWRFWIDADPTVSPFRWGRGAQAESLHTTGVGNMIPTRGR
ncbi:DNA-3-methyladenine glycosylase [Microbacterium sp. KSW4-16]|uniref:DNA-3-methyladenine glycosylase n=1 Tax=Microbacterium TaxID=33882 RepID=UPI0011BB2225|nr:MULTISPECIES: DNA-3-methyladenine glycosylase [Microbacterium]MCK8467948.1 DNA-3-methyladenine glycosylase [Microbacterium aurugineum]QEA27756.1 DNA-3-methyladenine glycosylase [Microbacterium sp. CBA3102]